MSRGLIVAGTDTNVGKTVLSAALMLLFPSASYWKPIQAGVEELTDSAAVSQLTVSSERIIQEAYRLPFPLSPNQAAKFSGQSITLDHLKLPRISPIIVECAGGLMVPLNQENLQIEAIADWDLPVVLVCRSSLGTINHSLLSLFALQARSIPIAGFIQIGEPNVLNASDISKFGNVPLIGTLPFLPLLDAESLRVAASEHLDRSILSPYLD